MRDAAGIYASSLCHLAMKQSAASTIPRCHFLLFLAALAHNNVSTPNRKGELSVDPAGQLLIGRRLYGRRKEETSFADGRLNALALCLFEGLGIRHKVVSALSALEANDP